MPFATEVVVTLIVIDCSVPAVTLSATLLEVMPDWAAVILLEPIADPVARPVALMLTAEELDEVQVAVFVKDWVLPSLKVPMAVN